MPDFPESFTIRCDRCGTEQVLTEKKHYDTEKIGIDVNPWADRWESLGFTCKNPICKLEF